MKKLTTILFAVCFVVTLKSQNMSNLYENAIDHCYKRLHSTLDEDSLYISDFSACENSNFPYNINTSNKKIKFDIPNVDEKHPFGTVYKLNYPELRNDVITISLDIYSVRYNNGDKLLIFNGRLLYEFKYNKRKRDYVLMRQIDLGV